MSKSGALFGAFLSAVMITACVFIYFWVADIFSVPLGELYAVELFLGLLGIVGVFVCGFFFIIFVLGTIVEVVG